ncbi:MAG: AAA family ATPase [Candidatus Aminicenantes bacterium]|nr:MAG: AAA family ATPase [Candidatus Aminicenantes bacterium]
MSDFPYYRLEKRLYEGNHTVVYRGHRSKDKQRVILKILKDRYPTPEEVARFRREYEITRNLGKKVSGVIAAYDIEKYKNRLLMVLEDFGGESLTRLRQMKLPKLRLSKFLHLAIGITGILGDLHRQHVIHKDINPSNIVWNPKTNRLKIIDFGISTLLPLETVHYVNPDALEGTLAYISPEQTGGMNRSIDYRTDFYSLGVTFYELLTSQLPFDSKDPKELIHLQLTGTPLTPKQLNPDIPTVLSDIVMKLIARNARDRYQGSVGLKYDLQRCLEQFTSLGVCQYFSIGQEDVSAEFQIPQKLYGRQKEIRTLFEAFERTGQGAVEMILAAGEAGIGKTALVQELRKPIAQKQGYFISGKYDPLKQNIPYAPLTQAFRELTRQLLTESEAQIDGWKSKILDAVGKDAQVIIDVVPELERIIGKQEPVPELPSTQAQNRFYRVLQNFVRVFAASDHPLIIYLDNLQWIDLSLLNLIERFLSGAENQYLLLIGAYRDNEVAPSHPLIEAINALDDKGITVPVITLPSLGLADIAQLIADVLHCSPGMTEPLAKFCRQKTGGNPLFLKQLLCTLYQRQLIRWDSRDRCWRWDTETIKKAGITGNVPDLIVGKIKRMPAKTQHALKLAAAVGSDFTLKSLASLMQKPYKETLEDLWPALQENFISPTDEKYKYARIPDQSGFKSIAGLAEFKFTHDRIQQAAYSLVDDRDKAEIQFKIGRLMLEKIPKEQQNQKIFDIVNHLDAGLPVVTQQSAIIDTATLNLYAARKAKSCLAFQRALEYVKIGMQVLQELPEASWKNQYELEYQLYNQRWEIEHLLIKDNAARHEDIKPHMFEETLLSASREKKLERRRYKRYQVQDYRLAVDGLRNCDIKNISIGGLCLKAPQKLALNNIYSIEIHPSVIGGITFKGYVVWWSLEKESQDKKDRRPCYETGLKFIKLSDSQKKPLKTFLSKLAH